MSTEAQAAELYDEPLGAAALQAGRRGRWWVTADRRHVPAIGVDATADPQTLGERHSTPAAQDAAEVELDRTPGRLWPADGFRHGQAAACDAPQRDHATAERSAQLVQQHAAALVKTLKGGFAHRDLGWLSLQEPRIAVEVTHAARAARRGVMHVIKMA
jgi:hypothetical protein